MATERKTGLGALPTGLLRPTTAPEPTIAPDPPEPGDDRGEVEAEGQGGRAEAKPAVPKPRRKRVPVGGETKGRKLHLPDDIHDRLWLLARSRRQTVSAVATDVLDKALPRYRVEREG